MDHNGSFHKGYLQHSPEGGFLFDVRRNPRSTKVDWSVNLPDFDFVQQWTTLVGDDILIPGHTAVSLFLRSSTFNNTPSANFVSGKNLLSPCPPSLLNPFLPWAALRCAFPIVFEKLSISGHRCPFWLIRSV